MTKGKTLFVKLSFLFVSLLLVAGAYAQEREEPGKPIGKVSVVENLILMELDEGALGRPDLFDLRGRSLRFTPSREGYRVENLLLEWDADFGQKITDPHEALHNFSFPFSGKNWNAFTVGVTGSIRFGDPDNPQSFGFGGGPPRDQGGVSRHSKQRAAWSSWRRRHWNRRDPARS